MRPHTRLWTVYKQGSLGYNNEPIYCVARNTWESFPSSLGLQCNPLGDYRVETAPNYRAEQGHSDPSPTSSGEMSRGVCWVRSGSGGGGGKEHQESEVVLQNVSEVI